MAILKARICSKKLMRNVNINIILPVDKEDFSGKKFNNTGPFKTLYLLHGIFGDGESWLYNTNINKYAMNKNIAVIMPSGENMFYVDKEDEHNLYGQFIGEELVDLTRLMFNLSTKREDTYIAGLSMGGYGAIRNGLKYSHNFSHVAGLSSALIVDELKNFTNNTEQTIRKKSFVESIFGDITDIETSDKNPKYILNKFVKSSKEFPKLYLTCGTEDPLLEENRKFASFVQELNLDCTYEEYAGKHDWPYWDMTIQKVLEWLP